MAKPTDKPEWASGGGALITTPISAKKLVGWIVEKPPLQFFNYLAYWTWQWINYFETTTDQNTADIATETAARIAADSAEATTRGTADTALQNKILSVYDAIVGAASYCTDTTIAAAITRVSAGARILVLDSFALATTVTVSKANLEIHLKPGVIISAGVATTGFTVSASGLRLHGGKISGFTTAVDIGASGARTMTRDIWFSGNTTDINDPNDLGSSLGCVN